ncbi:DEAD/DEAH box helicase [Pseudoxanthomonas winnipegensis]|uniref:DEAD/DEAH box helicase n=1 Tax=Pseudoxanthomonas winnipegensis TaxID=2480810 RepID=UPI00197D9313|nr:DEAD/DEAH box helicase [Pseudoxanthomonas winnipegensis]
MLKIDYRDSDRRAVLSWESQDGALPWISLLSRLVTDHTDDATQELATVLTLPWYNFAALRGEVLKLFSAHGLALGKDVGVGASAARLLKQSHQTLGSYQGAVASASVDDATLQQTLTGRGFLRALSPEQLRNVGRMAPLPAAATFSVPGAGKTTEALAYFIYRAVEDERLLVIAPKNAFASWDEQLAKCAPHLAPEFVRLKGGRDKIEAMLAKNPRCMIITYQQLVRVTDLIAAHCAQHPCFIYLDESHRIKSGVAKQTARATLSLSHLPTGKLVMSGTPMPQSTDDLIPQFAFLYPEVPARAENVVDLIRPVYVRTNKGELGLKPVDRSFVPLRMAPFQHELYQLMKQEVARDAATALSIPGKQVFRALGRSVARLLQFVSNPALLASEIGFAHADMLAGVLAEGDGPKINYVLHRARSLSREGKKVLIWSSFVRNVEYLAERLSDVGAVFIHGGVDAGDEEVDGTREAKIKQFRDDPNTSVLVANPAAASEGVSLHDVCHHAIYLDRTFNAAHYLQSEDRIHRFGLPADQDTRVEIVECLGTVDETVRTRLDFKITQMADALNDSSLRPDPIALDPSDIDDYEEYSTGLASDDIRALLFDLGKAVS